ncbi:MAG: hypothetical protein V8R91_07075 [Butyricimonas faecihominis]
MQEQAIKYQRLMQMIDAAYVDTVNLKKLTEDAIVKVLADWTRIPCIFPKKRLKRRMNRWTGVFSGSGFNLTCLTIRCWSWMWLRGTFREGGLAGRRPDYCR